MEKHYKTIETTILIELHVQFTSFHYNLVLVLLLCDLYNCTSHTLLLTFPTIQGMYYMQRGIVLGGLYST